MFIAYTLLSSSGKLLSFHPQGEMALEEFLKQVREKWNSYELELIDYQKRCRLIKGWDDLFDGVREHINSVSAMKLSPFYKV